MEDISRPGIAPEIANHIAWQITPQLDPDRQRHHADRGICENFPGSKQSVGHQRDVNDQKRRNGGEQTQVERVIENERNIQHEAEVDDGPFG